MSWKCPGIHCEKECPPCWTQKTLLIKLVYLNFFYEMEKPGDIKNKENLNFRLTLMHFTLLTFYGAINYFIRSLVTN